MEDADEIDAASAASDCGDMDSTGILCDAAEGGGFDSRKVRTSVWDWRVMRTDSADVIHPLHVSRQRRLGEYKRASPAC